MTKEQIIKRIKASKGEIECDLIITNGKIIDIYNHSIIEGQNIGIIDGIIAGIGNYTKAKAVYDAKGQYISPGFMDGHLHVESTHLSPEKLGNLVAIHGTTTLIADPHEITNVCGLDGLKYMIAAGKRTPVDYKFMLPSCVPATPFENAGAVVDAEAMKEVIGSDDILGLGEYMNYPGLLNCVDSDMDKIELCHSYEKIIDGHSPGLSGLDLNAYTVAGISDDHECSTIEEMDERVKNGMYILLRQGTSCKDLPVLVKGINEYNYKRCLFCTDDKQAATIKRVGHIEEHLRMCVENGVDPFIALSIATVNGAECFHLYDRGAIAPGKRADLVFIDSLEYFNINEVFIEGKLVAKDQMFLGDTSYEPIDKVGGSVHLKNFSADRFKLKLKSNRINTIDIKPGGVLTALGEATVDLDEDGDFIYKPGVDLCKVAVVERHNYTGNVAVAILKGYGIVTGAIGISVAHDSHNIIVAGTNDEDMAAVVKEIEKIGGGIVIVNNGEVLTEFPMPIAGLMSDQEIDDVIAQLNIAGIIARDTLEVSRLIDPITTLSFMALPVIPEVKLTDIGLFDVTKFDFISIEK